MLSRKIIIWDKECDPPESNSLILLWRQFPRKIKKNIVSIPEVVEKNDALLKKQYLEWVYELGKQSIHKKSLIRALSIRPNFSYWWMTLVAEKFNYLDSSLINDAIKMLAFNLWVSGNKFDELHLISQNTQLAESLSYWCKQNNCKFKKNISNIDVIKKKFSKNIFSFIPLRLSAILFLIHYILSRRCLIGVGKKLLSKSDAEIVIFSYLYNLDAFEFKNNKFRSKLWAGVPEYIRKQNKKINWVHVYVKHNLIPNPLAAKKYIQAINENSSTECHVTLDAFLSMKNFYNTLRDWIRVIKLSQPYTQKLKECNFNNLYLWPFISQDWNKSIYGPRCLENLMQLNLIESAMGSLKHQKLGLYMYEQQPWELALIESWRVAKNSFLLGVQHASILFWDLRYFFDVRSIRDDSLDGFPIPDAIAVNGDVAMSSLVDAGVPNRKLIKLEALRYLDLGTRNATYVASANKNVLRILVLADYFPSKTNHLLKILFEAIDGLNSYPDITIRLHPATRVTDFNFLALRFKISDEPIKLLLDNTDIAYTSNATSAAIDAYLYGVPVISVLDGKGINMSPLNKLKGATFISSGAELLSVLKSINSLDVKMKSSSNSYFYLDKNIVRWKAFLREKLF